MAHMFETRAQPGETEIHMLPQSPEASGPKSLRPMQPEASSIKGIKGQERPEGRRPKNCGTREVASVLKPSSQNPERP